MQNLGIKEITIERTRNKKGTVVVPRFSLKLKEIGMQEDIIEEADSSSNESNQSLHDIESNSSSQEDNEEEDLLNQSDSFPIEGDVPDFEDITKSEEIIEYLNVIYLWHYFKDYRRELTFSVTNRRRLILYLN